ncbi:MAG: hypothetical protein JO019_03455 [Candidatus Kaiserbacteria bacterium]|nr:hypothetical protein [Candidatus Kaiserbacteria bacterium]
MKSTWFVVVLAAIIVLLVVIVIRLHQAPTVADTHPCEYGNCDLDHN